MPSKSLLITFVVAGAAACSGSNGQSTSMAPCDMAPLIFVHGLGQDSSIFDPAMTFLREHGVPGSCLHAIDLSPDDGDNIRAAERQIAPFVEAALARVNAERASASLPALGKVQILGHSMGALSARWYAAIVAPARVATFISTSGANHGTDWQCSNPYGPGHFQMCPAFARSRFQSRLQFRLNGAPGPDVDETPYGLGQDAAGVARVAPDAQRSIVYLTLRTANDAYIVPAKSLELDGAGGGTITLVGDGAGEISPGNFQLREPSGHDELLSSPDALKWLLQVVRSEAPRNP